jgi:hypothetical protein
MKDNLGVEIQPTDTVFVASWGYGARLVDTGTRSPVVRINRKRVVIVDSDGLERAVDRSHLQVMRRDGVSGFEGNVYRDFDRDLARTTEYLRQQEWTD